MMEIKIKGCTASTARQKIPQGSQLAKEIVLAIWYHKDCVSKRKSETCTTELGRYISGVAMSRKRRIPF